MITPDFVAEDLPALFEEFGVEVTVGATTLAKGGIPRCETVPVLEHSGAVRNAQDLSVLVIRGSFPELAIRAPIRVAGVDYQARDVKDVSICLTRAWLQELGAAAGAGAGGS